MKRRTFLTFGTAMLSAQLTQANSAKTHAFDFERAKQGYLERLRSLKQGGTLPIIDIESSYNPLNIDLPAFVKSMDRAGIAMMCLSVDQPGKLVGEGAIWSNGSLESYHQYPSHFIPTGNGGNHPAWTKLPEQFLAAQEQFIIEHGYPLMGEFEVRHYPSPRQVARGEMHRDVDIAINSSIVERVFAFSEKTGIPFQVHYEVEDRLLDPFADMLMKFPKAKVIWCHLAQIRYQSRATRYSPKMVRDWLQSFPNLYFDTAFGDSLSTYPPSGERHARYWINKNEWNALISEFPWRFLAALDIGGDRLNKVEEWSRNLRQFLGALPLEAREIVAYKAAWKLLFGEEINV